MRCKPIRTVVHLSDLHFGAVDESLVPPLIEAVKNVQPDILAVSGDFTQHAWPGEFQKARALLDALPGKPILVAGNHDMAFYNPWRRATQRLKLFHKHITDEIAPFFLDREVAVLGLNTARIRHLRNGRFRSWQLERLEKTMYATGANVVRILVTHHPFDLPGTFASAELIGRKIIKRVVRSVDVLLAGHMHISHAAPTATRYAVAGHSAVFVQAGTALSTRVRGEANGFQVLKIESKCVETTEQLFVPDANAFQPGQTQRFERTPSSGWRFAGERQSGPARENLAIS